MPFAINLHWISQENYRARLKSDKSGEAHRTSLWPLGCEQHLVFCYLVRPIDSVEYTQNLEETDGIGWFSLADLSSLSTTPDIKQELEYVLGLY
jgi:hypothetical protein